MTSGKDSLICDRAEKVILTFVLLTIFCSGLIFGDSPKHKKRVLKVYPSTPRWIYDRDLTTLIWLRRPKSEISSGRTSIVLEFEYIGTYFITAYCPAECGYNGNNFPAGWTTASGEICHYSEEWDEPTTCAIDRNYHGFGEVILVGDPDDPDNRKIYITEDTGPGVRGRWVDCFVESMEEVYYFPTRYESVYRVIYTDVSMTEEERQEIHDGINNYFHHRGGGY